MKGFRIEELANAVSKKKTCIYEIIVFTVSTGRLSIKVSLTAVGFLL